MKGRKPKPAGQTREIFLRIRLTAAERSILDRAAQAKSLETSSWARSELMQLAKRILEPSDK